MAIRTYRPEDFEQIRQNLEEGGVYYELRDSQENYTQIEETDPGSILVAELNDEIVGSIVSQRFGIRLAFLWSLAVAEKHRRQGIATQLATAVDGRLRTKGVKEVWGFVHVENIPSQELLKRFGFQTNTENIYFGPWKEL